MSTRTLAAALAVAAASFGTFAGGALAKKTSSTTPTVAVTLRVGDAFSVAHRTVDVPNHAIAVSGEVAGYAPGEHLTLETFLGRRRVGMQRLHLYPSHGRRAGRFAATVSASGAGELHLAVFHHANPALGHFHTTASLQILAESSADPLYVRLVQQRLVALHLYLPQSGRWDLQTELAIEAYHRLIGSGTSAVLDPATLTALLDGRGTFTVRYPHQGRHVEGDLSNQLVALINGSQVVTIYPISSGKPSTPTILGSYRVYRRVPGYLPDGMYYSDFFISGYALHGYDPAPNYPASHGCMRLPISDAISAFDWLALGDWVDVYGTPTGNV